MISRINYALNYCEKKKPITILFQNIISPNLLFHFTLMTNRSKFTPEEDQKLIYIVSTSPEIKWSKVAEIMKNKTSRQCRERYKNYLANGINQSPWTPEEDQVLLKAYAEIGPCWSHMTSLFQGRTCVNIKNHYAKIKNKTDKSENLIHQIGNGNKVDKEKTHNTIQTANFIPNVNHPNLINNNNLCNVNPYIITPIVPQITAVPQIPAISHPLAEISQNSIDHNTIDQTTVTNPVIPNTCNNQNVVYDYKVLTRKQQVFHQLQLQHQQQFKETKLNELKSSTEKKGPLYVLPFFGDTNKIESSPDSFVNLISLKVKNDSKKLIDQDNENTQAINFYENDQDVLLCQHQFTTISEAPSLMLSANNASIHIESPIYEPDSLVERDEFSTIYDFSHDYGDFNACQDALFISLR